MAKLDLKTKKELFLKSILGNNSKYKYKRYLGSTLRYGGGKSLAVGYIIENLPNNIKKVVSPFIGGGSLEIALAKELNIEVVAYDIFDLLVNFWQQQINHPVQMYEKLLKLKPTVENYIKVKQILQKHWNKIDGYDNKLSKIDAAVYYYYNMQLSYGPGFLGWMSSIYKSEQRYQKTIEKVKNFSADKLKVHCLSFEKSIPKHNKDFLYLDPPYFLGGDSRMFKGIYPMRNFPIHHNNFNHQLLLDLLKKHTGGFILSYNDCSWVRENYKNFKIIEVCWQYTMGQGETRIGKNRLQRDYDNNNIKTSHELLIIGEAK